MPEARTFAKSIDYLGVLSKTLKDLNGFSTLAHELIQNAEDAKASHLKFNITPAGLFVDNDGVFSDCGRVEEDECPWRSEGSPGHRCDFHRFRTFGAADKREEVGTVGAFGIGFTAVYQITDEPALISAGRHWIIDETQPEQSRIRECTGCIECTSPNLPGTRFLLPWATDTSSPLRKRLRAEAVSANVSDGLKAELLGALPTAMLFLSNLRVIELWAEQRLALKLEREPVDSRIILAGALGDRAWHIIKGDFQAQAESLKASHPNRIEAKRRPEIAIAIPEDLEVDGLLSAFLPTQHRTDLPFHIQADFFPSSDRKRVLFDGGFETEWNTAAINAAAQALAGSVHELVDVLGPIRLWKLAAAVYRVGLASGKGNNPALELFWKQLAPQLQSRPSVPSTEGELLRPSEILLLEKAEEETYASSLIGLGLPVVHAELRPFFGILRATEIGVELLDIDDIAERIRVLVPREPADPADLGGPLDEAGVLQALWNEIAILLQRPRKEADRARVSAILKSCPIVPCLDGRLRSGHDTYFADEQTIEACRAIGLDLPFAASVTGVDETIHAQCIRLSVQAVIEELEKMFEDSNALRPSRDGAIAFILWFEDKRSEWVSRPRVVERLRSLPVFPTRDKLRPLTELSLPGDFVDPLGLASLVDMRGLEGKHDFLRDLGARELTLLEYAELHIPLAFDSDLTSDNVRRQAVRLLADRLGELSDSASAQEILSGAEVIECTDSIWRKPCVVYQRTEIVEAVLGDSAIIAAVSTDHQTSLALLWDWLGVASEPRFGDVLRRMEEMREIDSRTVALARIANAVQYLGKAFGRHRLNDDILSRFGQMAWLPGKWDPERFYRPDEIFASFQEYLFASVATFLDLPPAVQRDSADFLKTIGVRVAPSHEQVVNHLLRSTETGAPVNQEVFRFLRDETDDSNQAALHRLRGKPFIPLPDGTRLTPNQVFWGVHPFGRWRATLGTELRQYQELFDRFGVRESPDWRDALEVLQQLASEYGLGNKMLDDEGRSVTLACWQLLSTAIVGGEDISKQLLSLTTARVVPGPRGILEAPEHLFFDDRGGHPQFPPLQTSIIPRIDGAWIAMAAAGVRSLDKAAQVELLECDEPQLNGELSARILSQAVSIRRVLSTSDRNMSIDVIGLGGLLSNLKYITSRQIVLRYSITAFGHLYSTEPQSVTALFVADENTLYVTASASSASIARELTKALDPDDLQKGAIASGLREVLSAESPDAAQRVLDELGYAPALFDAPALVPGIAVSSLGETSTEEGADSIVASKESLENMQMSSMTHSAASPPASDESVANKTEEESSPPATDQLPGKEPDLIANHTTSPTSLGSAPRSNRPQSRLRSYVIVATERSPQNKSVADRRTALDQAGVQAVLEYERKVGRVPTEMPHTNPGFDIESRDKFGQIVRYIEVKSTGDIWGERGVALSDVQYNLARVQTEQYWLYVVVRPSHPDCEIYRIQNPADHISEYVFDSGWSVVTETIQS